MADKDNDKGRAGGDRGKGKPQTINDNGKKSENTVSFDRPTPQKPKKG